MSLDLVMRIIPLRRLLSKLTCLALSAQPVAASASPCAPPLAALDDDADLDADLPLDSEHLAPRDAAAMLGRTLANALPEMRPLAATHLATTWALSADPVRRAAIAHALERRFPLLGDRTILEHLVRDREAAVTEAARHAASARAVTV